MQFCCSTGHRRIPFSVSLIPMPSSLLAFIAAFTASVISAPIVARLATMLGVVDAPDAHRKLHDRPVPLTGGPTVLFSTIVGGAVTLWFYPHLLRPTQGDFAFLICLFTAGAIIVLLGLLDDRFQIRGRQKLVGQFFATLVMLKAGITIQGIHVFGFDLQFGDLAPIITVFWLLGAINALNLIDGVDGLASTTGIVLSLSIACVAWIYGGRPDGMLVSLVLAGSLCGFLVYNFPPARMFLGDSGSMLIGLILGAVALKCSIKQYTAATLIMPTAIWAIPIFDVSMAILRRKLTGRSIYATDRGHLHHCLQRKGHNGAKLLLVVGSLCAITGLGAIIGSLLENELITVVAVVTAICLLVLTRSFGHTEMGLLKTRIRRLAGSMIRRPSSSKSVLHDDEVRLHGDHDWQTLWETLTAFADRFDMDNVELMVNLPAIGEEYHASWKRASTTGDHEAWRCEIPLIVQDMRVGHIRVVGAVGDGSICEWMSELIGGLRAFEDQLIDLIRELRERKLRGISEETHSPVPLVAATAFTRPHNA
jgi:UDP-GlcNAc:undecaprenyl-phosphate GlcNAc-1-phosphate transferase